MRIAFLYPAWTSSYGLYGYFNRRGSVYPPLNLALLAAIAEREGHTAIIIDAEVERLTQDQLIDKALAFDPDVIALTATSPFFHVVKNLALGIKNKRQNLPILIGGPHVTITKEESFLHCFDFLFVGEAENSFPEFLKAIEDDKPLKTVKGLMFREGTTVVSTGDQELITNLDALPLPARHLLKMEKYKIGTLKGRLNFTSIQGVRGCPWRCIFCYAPALNSTVMRYRSPQSIVDEIRDTVKRYNIRHFFFLDDVLTLNKQRTLDFCTMIDQYKLKITFEGNTRANLVDEEVISRLKNSGLIRLSFGLESTDPSIRDLIGKKVPIEAYEKANKLCNNYNIEVLNSVMLGLPGETRETIRETLKYLRSAKEIKQANFAIAVPYPGTAFYDMAVKGENGVKLVTKDLSKYKRYGSAVTQVGELTTTDLVDLQNEGFVSIYSAPWRWKPMVKKTGVIGGLLTLLRVIKLTSRKITKR